jgi:predicted flavoprotein YhiN
MILFHYNFAMLDFMKTDVLVIGGGPSGLICSILASGKRQVLLLDRPTRVNQLGKRILVSGNGRANFFNEELLNLKNYPEYRFLVQDEEKNYAREFISFLEKEGFPYTKEGSLYYPYFKRSECLHSFLMERMNQVKVLYGLAMKVFPKENRVLVLLDGRKVEISYRNLVVSIGGRSFDREDYSYDFLTSLNVNYLSYRSMLCPVRTKERIPAYLSKQRLRVRLHLLAQGKEIYTEDGEVLFKEDGLSGIAVFDSTKYLLDEQRRNPKAEFAYVLDYSFDGLKEKDSLSSYPTFLRRYLEDEGLKPTKELFFHFQELYPFRESQASYGGILLSEIDEKSLTLRKYPNISCIGEMLDVNLKCGGYNMGMSLVEGYRIGRRLLENVNQEKQ